MIRHVYFHIPFCAKLCPYCSFHVETAMRNKSRAFLEALLRETELQAAAFSLRPETLYFGGGTPTTLSLSELDYLLTGLRVRLDLSALTEFTFEINPATVSLEKARLLHRHGVNRISMGVQSWDDAVLQTLGRAHTTEQSWRTFCTLREAGFTNINLDLMFAVPGQTLAQWQETLARTIVLEPEHISAYCLTYEEDTEYFRRLRTREFTQDDELDAEFFETTMDVLTAAGYAHYEISNYAKIGHASRHNQGYWRGHDYVGIGPSAFSTVGAERWQNVADSRQYTERMAADESAIFFTEPLPTATKLAERLALGLRTQEGVPRAELDPWTQKMSEFRELGFLREEDGRVSLTRRGQLMADSVAETFV